MQLVIDIGNTRVKAAIFEKEALKEYYVFDSGNQLFAANLFEKHAVTSCIVATVVNEIDSFVEKLKEKTSVLLFSGNTPTPITNCYLSVDTLGSDRLAGAVGGNLVYPNNNVLVIDAGTCIKYNFVNNKNEFIGGGISPGLEMRFNALHTFTAKLPLVQIDKNFETLIGKNTGESILSGVEIGTLSEIEGIINRYQQEYPDLITIITGGDVNFFEKRLKKPIFADQFLILKGLNKILDYNH